MSGAISLEKYDDIIDRLSLVKVSGRVVKLVGLLIRASVPGVRVGEICLVRSSVSSSHMVEPLKAEVVGFDGGEAILMPLGEIGDVEMGAEVVATRSAMRVAVGPLLLGRVLNGLGEPIDSKGPVDSSLTYPVQAQPPSPLARQRVTRILATGVRAIDGLLTVGEGQRIGIYAAAGVGKSTLLGMLARNTESDLNVIALVGERGREVRDFIEQELDEAGRRRSVIVVATSNEPSLIRLKAAHVATTIAGYFRDQGKRVHFIMDSITRFARAIREVGLAAGEPPARAGFPPSVFSELPRILERTGNSDRGSITAFYSVLVEGDDLAEPIADETRALLDGHFVLSRSLAAGNHYPAIDIAQSVSRVMTSIATPEHIEASRNVRDIMAVYESQRDFITIGAYKKGSDRRTDYAISKIDTINRFLKQGIRETSSFQGTIAELRSLF
ncbi:MAG TPA: FliI/YscN family ATPase [Blastocatellia bacterium]|nr:FliI/YscN family ATPase [Blastocatellia bacterium]